MLFDALEIKRQQLDPLPPRPYHAELGLPIRLPSGAIIPAADETTEDPEPEINPTTTSSSTPVSAAEAAAQNIEIEEDSEINPTTHKPVFASTSKPKDSKPSAPPPPKPQILITAEEWATTYRASNPPKSTNPNTSAGFSALRAYALWYNNPTLTLADCGAMLRDPPLKTTTITAYILDAVRLEKLPFEKERLREVLGMVPNSQTVWRYSGLWKMVQ
jgi:hypothetical protein